MAPVTFSSSVVMPINPKMAPPAGYNASQLILEDQFLKGSLDTTIWNPSMGNTLFGRFGNQGNLPSPYSAVSNGATPTMEYGSPTQIRVGNGLQLIATPDNQFSVQGYTWVSGYVATYNLFATPAAGFYAQFRAIMPDLTLGMWPAIWFLDQTAGGNEIDLFEGGFVTPYNQTVSSNLHTTGNTQNDFNTGVDITKGVHTYGVEYISGTSVKCFFDGTQMVNFTSNVPVGSTYELIIVLSVAAPGSSGFHAQVTASTQTQYTLQVSEVQVYHL